MFSKGEFYSFVISGGGRLFGLAKCLWGEGGMIVLKGDNNFSDYRGIRKMDGVGKVRGKPSKKSVREGCV